MLLTLEGMDDRYQNGTGDERFRLTRDEIDVLVFLDQFVRDNSFDESYCG